MENQTANEKKYFFSKTIFFQKAPHCSILHIFELWRVRWKAEVQYVLICIKKSEKIFLAGVQPLF